MNLSFVAMHQLSYILIVLEASLKSNYERRIDRKITRIDKIIKSRFVREKESDLMMKQRIVLLIFVATLFVVDYSVTLSFTRFVSDWALSLTPRIVFYLFCVQKIIYMSVVQQRLCQIRRGLDENEDDTSVLGYLEDIYIEIWELSKLINHKFQISFGIVLLQLYMDMTICMFWTAEYILVFRLSYICKTNTFLALMLNQNFNLLLQSLDFMCCTSFWFFSFCVTHPKNVTMKSNF